MPRSLGCGVHARWFALLTTLAIAVMVTAAPNPIEPPDVSEPRTQARAEEAGSFAVNSRTGAVGYTYAFKLPPARGVGASLALTYSSAAAIRGDIAHGWTLSPVAVVRRDVARETATSGPMYTAHFGSRVQSSYPRPATW